MKNIFILAFCILASSSAFAIDFRDGPCSGSSADPDYCWNDGIPPAYYNYRSFGDNQTSSYSTNIAEETGDGMEYNIVEDIIGGRMGDCPDVRFRLTHHLTIRNSTKSARTAYGAAISCESWGGGSGNQLGLSSQYTRTYAKQVWREREENVYLIDGVVERVNADTQGLIIANDAAPHGDYPVCGMVTKHSFYDPQKGLDETFYIPTGCAAKFSNHSF